MDSLKAYRGKRDFEQTPEPPGRKGKDSGREIFVVQKHHARNLHYDLRLQVNGVLRSWAVPKGPSMDPGIKRLALETEDHPLEYAGFEGNIPEGQYGAGSVIVWDTGPYRNITEKNGEKVPLDEALDSGHIAVWLEGRKLKGGFALTRTGRGWILVKMRDEEASPSRDVTEEDPRSVLSGLTVEEVASRGSEGSE